MPISEAEQTELQTFRAKEIRNKQIEKCRQRARTRVTSENKVRFQDYFQEELAKEGLRG